MWLIGINRAQLFWLFYVSCCSLAASTPCSSYSSSCVSISRAAVVRAALYCPPQANRPAMVPRVRQQPMAYSIHPLASPWCWATMRATRIKHTLPVRARQRKQRVRLGSVSRCSNRLETLPEDVVTALKRYMYMYINQVSIWQSNLNSLFLRL